MNGTKIQKGYAVIDGVAFLETTGDLLGNGETPEYRAFIGRIGFDQEVVIRLHTNASDAIIREFLGTVDYAGLNALLPIPATVVGQGIDVPLDLQPQIAEEMHELYEAMQKAQQKATQDKLENLDAASVIVNTMASSGFHSEGVVDITNDKVFENQELSQLTYVRTQDLLLQSALRKAEEDNTGGAGVFFNNLLSKARAADATADVTEQAAAPIEVKVRKGGGDGSSCSAIGSSKRCSVGSN